VEGLRQAVDRALVEPGVYADEKGALDHDIRVAQLPNNTRGAAEEGRLAQPSLKVRLQRGQFNCSYRYVI